MDLGNGGSVRVDRAGESDSKVVRIYNCVFTNNMAHGDHVTGGVIEIWNIAAQLPSSRDLVDIRGSKFVNNDKAAGEDLSRSTGLNVLVDGERLRVKDL